LPPSESIVVHNQGIESAAKNPKFDPRRIRARYDENSGMIHLTDAEGQNHQFVRVKRLFPHSDPYRHLVFQNKDGDELFVVDGLGEFSPEAREAIDQALDRRYFTPKVLRFHRMDKRGAMISFSAETDRGDVTFHVRNWRDSAYEFQANRWMILTVDGQRYEIPNLEALDPRSRQLIHELF
jgi:hypothetical protein